MDIYRLYAVGTAGYLSLQSLPLILTPRLITTLLASTPRPTTDLETYLSRALGFSLLSLAVLTLLLTGLIPLTSSLSIPNPTSDDESAGLPYALPTVIVTTIYHAISASYAYAQQGSYGFTAGLVLSAVLSCTGLWVIMFGSEKGRVSKSTGADKRTGNFPFENKESAREKKREGKEKEREREGKEGKRRSILRTSSTRG